jgi:16S rRNA processing protein RimM
VIGRPHGLDGSFHVVGANPRLLEAGARVSVEGELLEIDRRAGHDARVILRLSGYADRAAAETLRGRELLVAREQAPDLGPDEWWAEDLVGCTVGDGEQRIGVVRRLLTLPSCDVLEVERDTGEDLLVPLIDDAVRDVDTARHRIDVDTGFLGT